MGGRGIIPQWGGRGKEVWGKGSKGAVGQGGGGAKVPPVSVLCYTEFIGHRLSGSNRRPTQQVFPLGASHQLEFSKFDVLILQDADKRRVSQIKVKKLESGEFWSPGDRSSDFSRSDLALND